MKWWHKPYVMVFSISLSVWLILAVLRISGVLQPMELLSYDYLFSLRSDTKQETPVVFVAETETDIQQYGYPLSDEVFAKSLEKLEAAGVSIVGVDKYRDIPEAPGTEHLSKVLQNNKNIIWIFFIGNGDKSYVHPPAVLKDSSQIGFNDIVSDADGVSRRGLLFMDDKNVSHYSLSLLLALHYLEAEHITPQSDEQGYLRLGNTTFLPLQATTGSYANMDAGGYQFLLSYPHLRTSFPTFSINELLNDKIPESALRNKVVIIGAMASSLGDYVFFPDGSRHYGVELHAHITDQIIQTALHGYPLPQDWSDPIEYAWLLFWCVLGSTASLYRNGTIRLLLIGATGLGVLFAGALFAFHHGLWIPLLSPSLGWLAALILGVFWLFSLESNARRQLLQLFESHVSPQVAATLWEKRDEFFDSGGVKPDYLTATVLFTDLVNFTTLSEGMEPLNLMTWLNEYMDEMSHIIISEGGMINKYIGDAIMAVFGVPVKKTDQEGVITDALSAVESAMRMRERLQELNLQWQQQGLPTIGMRIGIHTGLLVAGTLGGQERMEYTVIGDTVNVASRLESFDKTIMFPDDQHCRILIGDPTWQLIHTHYATRAIGECQLKGKHNMLKIYSVLNRIFHSAQGISS